MVIPLLANQDLTPMLVPIEFARMVQGTVMTHGGHTIWIGDQILVFSTKEASS